jgi:5-enolpyruvylshikimate-3-phosphate synthase
MHMSDSQKDNSQSANGAMWPAPFRGSKPVNARVVIPGSKSVTNRALILAAQATSPSILRRPLVSRDSELMVAGLRQLGIDVQEDMKLKCAVQVVQVRRVQVVQVQ